MSGEIYLPINAIDPNSPDTTKIVVYAKDDGLYIRRPDDVVGMRLRIGENDSAAAQLLNNSGNTLTYGSVVIWDVTVNEAVTTTNVEADFRVAGVVNSQSIQSGYVGSIITLAGSIVDVMCDSNAVGRGHFLVTSSTPGMAKAIGYSITDNTFAIALEEKSAGGNGLVTAMLVHNVRTITAGNTGWSVGGYTTAAVANTQKLVIPNETWLTVIDAALPTALYTQGGLGYSIIRGYSAGGYTGSVNFSTIYRVVFSTEQLTTVEGVTLTNAKRSMRYGHNAGVKGWIVGGYTTTYVANTDRFVFATETNSAGNSISVADRYRNGVSDGTKIFTAGGETQPTNHIAVNTESISAYPDANIIISNNYAVISFPSKAGYYVRDATGAGNGAKIPFNTGVASVITGPNSSKFIANGCTDGISVGYFAPVNMERFNPVTESFTACANSMQIPKNSAAVFNSGAL